MRKKINSILGKVFDRFGYRVIPSYRLPQSTLNILEFAIEGLQRQKASLKIVQIGAYDGVVLDPLVGALSGERNQILLVEPQPEPFESLSKKYAAYPNVDIENCAVTQEDGEVKMYLPKNETSSPKASIESDHLKNFDMRESEIQEISVNALSVPSLLQKHGIDQIDVLQIDTEGQDYTILSQFLDIGIQPTIINLEIFHLTKETRDILREKLDNLGYHYVEYGWDLFALKEGEYYEKQMKAEN